MTVMTRKIDRSCRDHPDQARQEWIGHVRDTLIPYFQQLGFLNDDLLAQGLYNNYKNRGFSLSAIRHKMQRKGIDPDKIGALIQTDESGVTDRDAVLVFARKKKIGKFRPVPSNDPIQKKRDLGKLARAGFSYDVALSVFD